MHTSGSEAARLMGRQGPLQGPKTLAQACGSVWTQSDLIVKEARGCGALQPLPAVMEAAWSTVDAQRLALGRPSNSHVWASTLIWTESPCSTPVSDPVSVVGEAEKHQGHISMEGENAAAKWQSYRSSQLPALHISLCCSRSLTEISALVVGKPSCAAGAPLRSSIYEW